MLLDSLDTFTQQFGPLLTRLYRTAGADRWRLDPGRFSTALFESARHSLRSSHTSDDITRHLESLQVADLALACACAEGIETAWDHFVAEFRPRLYAAATAMAGDAGRELADSLYAELFGLETRDGRRRSLFEYFHGRSSLITWLRAVLGQRHVDRVRTVTRFRPLEEAGDLPGAGDVTEDADRTRYVGLLQQALTNALGALAARDRLRLSSYYLQQLRMAEIGRLLGESEATVSRKLERTRTHLRRDVEHRLRHDQRLTDPQVRLCFEYAVEHWPFDMTAALAGQDS